MEESKITEKHTAGPIAIAFDYQFYLFMYFLLELRQGQTIGFEVKDDIHIDKEDGTTILFQAKHSNQTNTSGETINLTTLDTDLWKTMSNWSDLIKEASSSKVFISKHSFVMATNKSIGINSFINSLKTFRSDRNINSVIDKLLELKRETQNETIKSYISNVISLNKRNLKSFLLKLKIETNTDDIINKIKKRIYENIRQENIVDAIFDSLTSNLLLAKYTEIKERNRFKITFDEFNSKFGKCFIVATKKRKLPKRNFSLDFPENINEQTFIKQLIDIGDIEINSIEVNNYTTQMLMVLNHYSYWLDEDFILPTEMNEFEKESLLLWNNAFTKHYRTIKRKINSGLSIEDLEGEIKEVGVMLIDFIREKNLLILEDKALGIEFSNGHFYAKSNEPIIGWHFDWENKYSKQ